MILKLLEILKDDFDREIKDLPKEDDIKKEIGSSFNMYYKYIYSLCVLQDNTEEYYDMLYRELKTFKTMMLTN